MISFLLYPKDQNQTHTKTEYTWFPKIGYSTEINWSYYQTVGSFTSEVSYLTTLSYIATAIEPHWSLWFFGTGVFDLPFLFWEHFCLFFPLNFLVWFSVLGIIWFCNAIFDLNLIHPSGFFFSSWWLALLPNLFAVRFTVRVKSMRLMSRYNRNFAYFVLFVRISWQLFLNSLLCCFGCNSFLSSEWLSWMKIWPTLQKLILPIKFRKVDEGVCL